MVDNAAFEMFRSGWHVYVSDTIVKGPVPYVCRPYKRGSHESLRQFVAQKVVEAVIRGAIFNRISFPYVPLVAFEIPIKTIGNVVKPPCMSPARLF